MWWSKWRKPRSNGFRKFDVLCQIGCSTKFVVGRDDGIEYKLWELYPVTQEERCINYVVKCACESQYVRVGKWDPTRKCEVDDVERD